ncbi:MAG: hypothetical protein GY705_18995 [Bacteroidetes bacterium]|nr:hypothetical protein [Bacteroidota bacterium]
MIPRNEQCHAILNAKEWELSQKYCDGSYETLETKLSITRVDLKKYISKHGYPKGWWRFEAATYDGLYTIEKEGNWIVYFQERGGIDYQYPNKFSSKEEAVDFVLDNVYLKKK